MAVNRCAEGATITNLEATVGTYQLRTYDGEQSVTLRRHGESASIEKDLYFPYVVLEHYEHRSATDAHLKYNCANEHYSRIPRCD